MAVRKAVFWSEYSKLVGLRTPYELAGVLGIPRHRAYALGEKSVNLELLAKALEYARGKGIADREIVELLTGKSTK